jgi:hypothetical protein
LAIAPAHADSLFPEKPFTSGAVGTTSAPFLKLPVSARAAALGESEAALSGSAESMFMNPAGLAWLEQPEAVFAYGSLLETSYLGTLGLSLPTSSGAWGLGMRYFSQSSIEAFNDVGDPTGSFRPFDMAASATYAWRFGRWSAGFGAKLIHSDLNDRSGSTVGIDAGLLGRNVGLVNDGPVDVGFFARQLGPPLKMGSQADPLPFEAGMGILWTASPFVRVLADVRAPVDQAPFATLGVEGHKQLGDSVEGALRAGYSLHNERGIDGFGGLTAGAGVELNVWRFDYAFGTFGDLGSTHRVTLGLMFGDKRRGAEGAGAAIVPPAERPKPKLAVLHLESKGLEGAWASAGADYILDALDRGGLFAVISREETDRLLRLAGAQDSCLTSSCSLKSGRAAHAERIVYGSVTYLAGIYYVDVSVSDPNSGKVLFTGTETSRQPSGIRDAAESLARRIETAESR